MVALSVVKEILDVVKKIYDVYKDFKDGEAQFDATYKRATDLLDAIDGMSDAEKAPLQSRLDQLGAATIALRSSLDKYSEHKFTKAFHQPSMQAEIGKFDQQVAALFQLHQLAIGALVIRYNRELKASNDELVRGMRELLQGGGTQKTAQSSEELLRSTKKKSGGPVARAQEELDVAKLVGFMRDNKDDDLVEQAAIALCEMAEEEVTRDAFSKADSIQLLVKMLETPNSASPPMNSLRVIVAHALHRLARRDVYEIAIVEAGALPLLAAILEDTSSSESETSAACAALARLAIQAEHKKRSLKTPNLIARMIELVHSGSVSQKKYTTNALRELANNDEECAMLIGEAIPVLVDMLYVGETAEERFDALGALWNLSSLEENRTKIAEECGIKVIVQQIRNGDSDEHCQLAASTLAVLAQDDKNDELISAAGGVKPLVKLLVSGTPAQKNSAAWALAELANHMGNAAEMVSAGASRALVAAFRSAPDIQRRSKAGLALMWIAELTEDKATVVNEIGLKSIVRLLSRGSTDQRQTAARILGGIAKDSNIQDTLRELGAIEMLIKVVDDHPSKQPAMDALRALARNNKANQIKIDEADGIKVIVGVLASFKESSNSGAEDNFISAVEVLKAIVGMPNFIQTFFDAEGIKILLSAVDYGSPKKQRSAVSFLTLLVKAFQDEDSIQNLEACTSAFLDILRRSEEKNLNDELIVYAANGLGRGSILDKGAVVRQNRNAFTFKIWTKIVRLLQSSTDEDVQTRAAETIYLLSSQKDFAIQLGQIDGLEGLVTLANRGSTVQFEYSALALINLSKVFENRLALTKIEAISVVATALSSKHDERDIVLEMVMNMPSQWNFLGSDSKRGVVERCVAALGSKTPLMNQLGLNVLTNIYDATKSSSYGFVSDIRKANGAEPLLNAFQYQRWKLKQQEYLPLINLLGALAKNDKLFKRKLGEYMDILVSIIRTGKPDKLLVAASVVNDLVMESEENALRAIKANVGYVFVRLVSTHDDSSCVSTLVNHLDYLNTPETLAEMNKIVRLLVDLLDDFEDCKGWGGAVKVLNMVYRFYFSGTFRMALLQANFLDKSAKLLEDVYNKKRHVDNERLDGIYSILTKLSKQIEFPSTIVDLLMASLQAYPSPVDGGREGIINILTKQIPSFEDNIGGSISTFVNIIENGTEKEQVAAIRAVSKLADRSKQNASSAINAGVAGAVAKLWKDNDSGWGKLDKCTQELLLAFDSVETSEATTASEEIIETIVLLATSGQSHPAWDFIDQNFLVWDQLDTIEDGGTSALCASILQRARETCEPMLSWEELRILEYISDSKYCNKIIESGAVDLFVNLLRAFQSDARVSRTSHRWCGCKQCQSIELVEIIGNVARNDVDQREVIGESGCIQVLSEMIRRGDIWVVGKGVNALASLCNNNPMNAEKVFHEDLLILCVETLPEDYPHSTENQIQIMGALRLFRSLANDKAFGPSIGRHEKIVEFALKILSAPWSYISEVLALIKALAKYDEARSKLNGVKTRLKELLETDRHSNDVLDALKAFDIAPSAAAY